MPKKTETPRIGADLRIRITIELDSGHAEQVEEIAHMLNCGSNRKAGISQVIRAAIRHFHAHGNWGTAHSDYLERL